MKHPKIIRKNEIEKTPIPFGGKEGDAGLWSVVIKPPDVDTKQMTVGTAEVNPGYAAKRWHTHTKDRFENVGLEITFPENFEEVYYLTKGSGILQWENEEGKIEEREVTAGDFMFFPTDVAKHQFFNNGTEKAVITWVGSPVALPTPIAKK